MLHHHNPGFIDTLQADRLARGRRPVEAGELERLVAAAAAGDEPAWSALVDRFTTRVRAVARRHRLPAHDVEDVMQTTWMRLIEHIQRMREPLAVGAWLDTTSRRESLRMLRAQGRERPVEDAAFADEPAAGAVDDRLEAFERHAALTLARERLPRRQRELLAMLLADPDRSYADIARTLDMPIGSIGPTRARCLARLRRDPHLGRVMSDDLV